MFAAKLALASPFVVNEDEREYLTSSDEDISDGRHHDEASAQSDGDLQIADQLPNLEDEDEADRKSERVVRKYSEDYDDDFMAMTKPSATAATPTVNIPEATPRSEGSKKSNVMMVLFLFQ